MREYAKFSQDLANLLGEQPQGLSLPQRFARLLRRVHQGRSPELSLMSTVYWADSYFSLAQAMWLDAYRRAIEGLPASDPARDPAIASLLHAAAYSSNSSGHFAQHRKPTSPEALAALARYRLRSVPKYWLAKMREVAEDLIGSTKNHSVTNRNFADLLRPDVLESIDAVYADPPYSAVHYSRFYHVLESLTLYDHPGSEFDGRYRPLPLRHQSPFSIESQVNAAFNTLIEGVAKAGKPLVISYSDSALLPIDRLKATCRTHYPHRVDVVEIGYSHATMGRRDTKSNAVVELLIVCRN
jgi:adenine-specific DNA-methyltransferase